MSDNERRLRELSNKAIEGDMTDEEFAELAQLSKAKQKLREDRVAMIAGLRETVQSQGITIRELFTDAEIAAAVPRSGSLGRRVVRAKPARSPSPAATWVRQKTGVALLEVDLEGSNGFPSRYCMGQILPYYVPKGLKLLDDGQLESNLARHFTETGKQYFATPEGQAELARLVSYIRSHKLKPRRK